MQWVCNRNVFLNVDRGLWRLKIFVVLNLVCRLHSVPYVLVQQRGGRLPGPGMKLVATIRNRQL